MMSETNALNLGGMSMLEGSIGDEQLGRQPLGKVSVNMTYAMAVAVGGAVEGHKILGQE